MNETELIEAEQENAFETEQVTNHVTINVDGLTGNLSFDVEDGVAFDHTVQMIRGLKSVLKLEGRSIWSVGDTLQFTLIVTNSILTIMLLILFFRLGTLGL